MQNIVRTNSPNETWTREFPMRKLHNISIPLHKTKHLTLRLRGPDFPVNLKFTGRRYMVWTSQLFLDALSNCLPALIKQCTVLKAFRVEAEGWAHIGSRKALTACVLKMGVMKCKGVVDWVQSVGDLDEVYLGQGARKAVRGWSEEKVTFSVK
jgi:hypothetical protein